MAIINYRDQQASFDLHIPDALKEVYTDGLGQILIGPVNSKIGMYSSQGISAEGIEQRHVNIRLTMPTIALLEFAQNIITNAVQSKEVLSEQSQTFALRLQSLLNDFQVSDTAANTETSNP